MGSWMMEVGRMFLYVTFPVSVFYYFNNPEWYEAGVEEMRRTFETDEVKRTSAEFLSRIQNYQRQEQRKHLQKLESGQSTFQ